MSGGLPRRDLETLWGLHLSVQMRRTSGARTRVVPVRAVEGAARAAQELSSRPRPPPAVCSSVGAMHCIHATVPSRPWRRTLERSLRSPRAEWDGAALRNSRVLCNSILPVRPPQATDDWASARAAYHAAVERHFGRVAQFGVAAAPASQLAAAASTSSYASPSSRALRSSRFQLAAHDARLLLLRLAHNEPLHQESGGGSRRSNLELCLYLLQMAGHQLQDRDAGGAADAALAQRERRHLDAVVAASLDRAQGSADQRKRAAEAAPHAALQRPSRRRTTAGPCSASGGPAPARSSGPWTARRAGPRPRPPRGAGGAPGSQGQPSPPNSPQRPSPNAAAPAPAPADVEAATAARAVTYARATLAYVASRRQAAVRARESALVPAATVINPPAGRTSLFPATMRASAAAPRSSRASTTRSSATPRRPRTSCASWTWTTRSILTRRRGPWSSGLSLL